MIRLLKYVKHSNDTLLFETSINDRLIDLTEIDSISLMNQFDVNQSIQ